MNTELVVYFVSSWHERPAFCFLLTDFALRALCTCCCFCHHFHPIFFSLSQSQIPKMSILSPLSICHLSFFFFMVFFVLYSRMGRGFRFSFKSKRPNLFEFRIGKVTPLPNPSQVFFSKILGHLSPFFVCMCVRSDLFTYNNSIFFFFFGLALTFFLVSVCLSLSPEAWYLFYWQNALVPATRVPKKKLNV